MQVGDRVLIAKEKATVRYVGAVDGYEGTWVGVEWDDPTRGKHDGCTGGKQYFTCSSSSPAAASFIRITKINAGISVVEALKLRYTNQLAEGQIKGAGVHQAHVGSAGNKQLRVEVVGQDQVTARQSKLDLLNSARIVSSNVSCAGPEGELAETAPRLQQLDLTDNLISSWGVAISICQQLPQLQQLNLSLNRLQLHSRLPDTQLQQLDRLHCLVLNRCHITWQQVATLQSSLPNLQELHVAGNSISSLRVVLQQPDHKLPTALSGFMSLEVLGLEDNAISGWDEVLRLGGLPKLKRLALSGNPINRVGYPSSDISLAALHSSDAAGNFCPTDQKSEQQASGDWQPPFAHLQALLLGDCQLSSWQDIDQLNRFPALCELRLSGNPLFSSEGCGVGGGRRFEVIGRVHNLTLLNGADVKSRERRDCELRYLQNVLAEGDVGAAGVGHHPRFGELQAKYGQVSAATPIVSSKQQGSSLNSTTCELLLQYGDATAKKKLPKSITIAALRLLCSRLFKVTPSSIQLRLVTAEVDPNQDQHVQPGEDLGVDDTKQLSYWDMADGCVVRVIAVAADEQRHQKQAQDLAKQQEYEHRVAQQLQQGETIRGAAAEL